MTHGMGKIMATHNDSSLSIVRLINFTISFFFRSFLTASNVMCFLGRLLIIFKVVRQMARHPMVAPGWEMSTCAPPVLTFERKGCWCWQENVESTREYSALSCMMPLFYIPVLYGRRQQQKKAIRSVTYSDFRPGLWRKSTWERLYGFASSLKRRKQAGKSSL